jgi:methionyl-tRNA formyltransferase
MTLRLAFMGTPEFAAPVLVELVGLGHEIACVYSQPARARGRGMALEPTPVHKLAQSLNIPVRTPASLREAQEQAAFAALKFDAAIVVAYGLILPKAVLQAPRLGCFNVHASLLPRWRGAAPIQRAIMANDAQTGVTIMRMEEGLDTGPMLMAERETIGRRTYGQLHDDLSHLGATLMGRALSAIERGSIAEHPQPPEGVTYAKKIQREEARIDWTRPAPELDCHIRGLSPVPGAWFEASNSKNGDERIKALMCEPIAGRGAPGEILSANNEFTIACGEGALKLVTVQRAGKGPMAAADFLRGFALKPGEQVR